MCLAIFVLLVGCESYTVGHADPNEPGKQGEQQPGKGTQGTKIKASGSVDLTDNEAKDILKELIPKAITIQEGMFNGSSWFVCDENQKIPGEEEYCLVTGESSKTVIDASNVKSISDLKKVVQDVFTKDVAQRIFRDYLETIDKGLPLYKEYNGQLYLNLSNGGHGWATKILTETAKIRSQKDNVVEIALDTLLFDEPYDTLIVKIEYVNGKWLMASRPYKFEPSTK